MLSTQWIPSVHYYCGHFYFSLRTVSCLHFQLLTVIKDAVVTKLCPASQESFENNLERKYPSVEPDIHAEHISIQLFDM